MNSSSPLLPGQTTQETKTFSGGLLEIGANYPVTITETFANGTEFAHTQEVQFTNSSRLVAVEI